MYEMLVELPKEHDRIHKPNGIEEETEPVKTLRATNEKSSLLKLETLEEIKRKDVILQ